MVEIGHAPARSEDQAGNLGQFLEIDLLYRIGMPVIIGMQPRKIEDDRYAFAGIVVVIAAVVEFERMVLIIICIVQAHGAKLLTGLFIQPMQLTAVLI